jgi:pilus assembly protein CpaF
MLMDNWMNLVLSLLVLIVVCLLIRSRFKLRKMENMVEEESPESLYSLEGLIRYVQERVHELTRTNLYELGLDESEFRKRQNKRGELIQALRRCPYGSLGDKQYVKDVIRDMLEGHLPETALELAVPFSQPDRMNGNQLFACLLHTYRRQYEEDAFNRLVERHAMDALRPLSGEPDVMGYVVTEEEIRRIYREEAIFPDRQDKLELLTQFVYERFKGLGPVDELRDMDVDGISAGVSGVTDTAGSSGGPHNCDSIWVFHRGKTIRLACLGFGSERELRRVCQNIYRYNKAGQLSEKSAYKVSDHADGARVVVVSVRRKKIVYFGT